MGPEGPGASVESTSSGHHLRCFCPTLQDARFSPPGPRPLDNRAALASTATSLELQDPHNELFSLHVGCACYSSAGDKGPFESSHRDPMSAGLSSSFFFCRPPTQPSGIQPLVLFLQTYVTHVFKCLLAPVTAFSSTKTFSRSPLVKS